MGAWICLDNKIEVGLITVLNDIFEEVSYKKLNSIFYRNSIIKNKKIKYIQISQSLPQETFIKIDKILMKRPDITLRIYGLFKEEDSFDLSVLSQMKYLQRLQLEAHLVSNPHLIDCSLLCQLKHLKSLALDIFDLKDYSFLQNLSPDLNELTIIANTIKGGIHFDCEWLLRYKDLNKLSLAKKARKNIQSIVKLPNLKHFTIRGIKLDSLNFLKPLNLESLSILWCGMNDLSYLAQLTSLKYLELWRIMKLEDISFISQLTNLEYLKLQDLKHIKTLPNLSTCHHLKQIKLYNMNINDIPKELKPLIKYR